MKGKYLTTLSLNICHASTNLSTSLLFVPRAYPDLDFERADWDWPKPRPDSAWLHRKACAVHFWNAPCPSTSSSTSHFVLRTEYSCKLKTVSYQTCKKATSTHQGLRFCAVYKPNLMISTQRENWNYRLRIFNRKWCHKYDIIFHWKFEVCELGSHAVWKSQDQDRTPYRMSDLSR